MLKEDWKNFLMIVATLFATILSFGASKPVFQLMFIIIFLAIYCIAVSFLNKKTYIKGFFLTIACLAEGAILFLFIASNGSVSGFFTRIKNLLVAQQEDSSVISTSLEAQLEPYLNDFDAKIASIEQKIDNTNNNIEDLGDDMGTVTDSLNLITDNLENIYFNNNINDIEVNTILEQINKHYEENSSSFENLKTDLYSLQLFYKMYITDETYYYCNILKAFQEYGIDIEKLEINEYTLVVWDVQILFATYGMKKSHMANIDNESQEITFNYNNYRVNMTKYSDTFDYGNWRRNYTGYTTEEISERLDDIMMDYYRKFIINFSVE